MSSGEAIEEKYNPKTAFVVLPCPLSSFIPTDSIYGFHGYGYPISDIQVRHYTSQESINMEIG